MGAPVAAVDEKDDWVKAFSGGKTNINELIWVLPVRKAQIRTRWFLFQDGFTLHAEQYRTAMQVSLKAAQDRSTAGQRLFWCEVLGSKDKELCNLAAKHAVDKNKVADGQQHAKAPPDQTVRK